MVNESDSDDVLICRCNEVTRREVREAIREGARSVDEVKRMTSAGMGICQGRTCSRLVAQLIHEETGIPMGEISLSRSRAPVRPVPAQILAKIKAPRVRGSAPPPGSGE